MKKVLQVICCAVGSGMIGFFANQLNTVVGSETEGWLRILFNTNSIDEETYKKHRNLCGRIRRMLIASCKTLKENAK